MSEQIKIALCRSTRVMKRPVGMSHRGSCAECDIPIWLAPSTVKLASEVPDLRLLCEECAVDVINATEELPIFALAPGALQEALAELRKVNLN